ncbi:MAG: hypothetical protein Q8P34_16990 [Bacteroidota bacterium]|nr:hypothetical protein [Bacteroidota bacterium]
MENRSKQSLLQSIGNVYEAAKGSQLKDFDFEKIDADLMELADYFKIAKSQAFMLANVFVLNYKGDTVDMNDLVKHFKCNPLRLLEFNDDIKVLYSKRILLKSASRNRYKIIFRKDQFILNENVTEAILNNLPWKETEEKIYANVVDLLEEISKLGKQREDEDITVSELLYQTNFLIETNQNLPLIRTVHQMNLKTVDAYFFFQIVWTTVTGLEQTHLGFPSGSFFEKTSDWMDYIQSIIKEENELVIQNLIEIEKADFFIDIQMKLSDFSLNILQEEGITLYLKS